MANNRRTAHQSRFRSLTTKYSVFTGVLMLWIAVVVVGFGRRDSFDGSEVLLVCTVVLLVGAAIARFTIRLLARPLLLLQQGITSACDGRLEEIRVSRTGDEIELLGHSFNRMVLAIKESREEIRNHQELLEDRIATRTRGTRRRDAAGAGGQRGEE